MEKPPIALLDCNNFFVSCERLFRPDLAKRPVLVLSSNDGCVVARSQEVKDIGIPMGVPYFQIKDIIKDNDISVFSSNFSLYRDLSARVFSVVKKESDSFEQYSIDEAFFLIKNADFESGAVALRDKILNQIGLPVSIGIAPSKTLAKFASKQAKRGSGVFVLTKESWSELASQVPLGELWGVGSRRALAFRNSGLLTAVDVMKAPVGWMQTNFGIEGARLWYELWGEPAYPIVSEGAMRQSITHSRSFGRSTSDLSVVAEAVSHHLQRAATELTEIKLCASRITVFIGAGRGSVTRRADCILGEPTADPFVLLRESKKLLGSLYEREVSYKKAGVVLSGLVTVNSLSAPLFPAPTEAGSTTGLVETMREISARFGSGVIQIGLLNTARSWDSNHKSLSPAYTTRWPDIPRVRCG